MSFLKSFSYPLLIHQTSNAGLLYTTPDLAQEIRNQYFTQVDIIDLVFKPFGMKPITEVTTLPSHQLNIYSARSSLETTTTSNSGLTMNSNSGRKYLNVNEYAERIAIDKPSIAIALADEVSMKVPIKRTNIAMKRSIEWYNDLLAYNSDKREVNINWEQTSLFGVVPCGIDPDLMSEYTYNLLDKGAKGIVLGGLYREEDEIDRRRIIRNMRQILNTYNMKNNTMIPLMVQGIKTAHEILNAVYDGIDMISCSYSMELTKQCKAIRLSSRKRNIDNILSKDTAENEDIFKEEHILITDEIYIRDVTPLMPNCQCHACRSHTKAYIHHLYKSKELLAEILIYQHNQYQLMRLFEEIRERLTADRAAFAVWAGIQE